MNTDRGVSQSLAVQDHMNWGAATKDWAELPQSYTKPTCHTLGNSLFLGFLLSRRDCEEAPGPLHSLS